MDYEQKRSLLKKKAAPYIPQNLDSLEAQKTLLAMLTAVVPPVKVCADKADRDLWPQVAANQMPLKNAKGSCAYEVNRILGITVMENLKLESRNQVDLLKAWVALDYYSYLLKEAYSGNIRKYLLRITDLLNAAPAPQPRNEGRTVAIQPNPAIQPAPGSRSASVSAPEKKPQKRKKTSVGASLAAVAALLVLVLALTPVLNKVKAVESAINEIGTVTLESEKAIENAEVLYEELSDGQKGRVGNYEQLSAARTEYDRLEKLVNDAITAIDSIGDVTLESKETIEAARSAYNVLEEDGLTKYVSEKEYILTRAERLYEQCVVDDTYASAAKLLEEEKYEEALLAFEDLIKQYPVCNKAGAAKTGAQKCLMVLADAALQRNDLQGAVKRLDSIANNYTPDDAYNELLGKVETRIKANHPGNGRTFLDKIGWGWGKVEVTAGDADIYVKLEDTTDPTKYMVFYVHANSTATVRVKDGNYIAKYTTGKYWYDQETMFGDAGEFFQAGSVINSTTAYSGSYVSYYKFTLDFSEGSDTTVKTIKAEEF